MTTDDPTHETDPELVRQIEEGITALRSMGMDDAAQELDAFLKLATSGELDPSEFRNRLNALMATMLGSIPGPFAPALAADPVAQLAQLTPELDPSNGQPTPEAAAPAGAVLAQALAVAGLEGQAVILTPEQALDLADLAAFAAYAREAVYPVIVALQPLVQRLGAMGDQLQTTGPAGIVTLLAGSFGKQS